MACIVPVLVGCVLAGPDLAEVVDIVGAGTVNVDIAIVDMFLDQDIVGVWTAVAGILL